jgi:hypothetical protein
MYSTVKDDLWQDTWFEELSVEERYLFLYCTTSPRQTTCGAFEITLRTLSHDTRLEERTLDVLESLVERSQGRVMWWPEHNTVWVRNRYKHQGNPAFEKYRIGAAKSLKRFSLEVQAAVLEVYPDLHTDDSPVPFRLPQAAPRPVGNEEGETDTLSGDDNTSEDSLSIAYQYPIDRGQSQGEYPMQRGHSLTLTEQNNTVHNNTSQRGEKIESIDIADELEFDADPDSPPHPDWKEAPPGNILKAEFDFEAHYAEFKQLYPARYGKRVGIDTVAKDEAEKLPPKLWPDLMRATRNYKASGQLPVDPIRWFKSKEYPRGMWREWVDIDPLAEGDGDDDGKVRQIQRDRNNGRPARSKQADQGNALINIFGRGAAQGTP